MSDALYLIDASGFVFRAYHALPPLSIQSGPRKGETTGAVYGFVQMLIKLEQEHHPTHMAVVWDAAHGEGFRDKLFAEYKANRDAPPPDLPRQFTIARQVVDAFRLSSIECEGCEADDVIATLARKARQAGLRVVIVSSDKDLMQLIGDEVRMVRPVWQGGPRGAMQDKLYGEAEVVERYGVPPAKLADVLALMGDSIDNIPGVKGVGEKTASALINHFGSLEELLAHLDRVREVPGLRGAEKVQRLLTEQAESARLSRKLVALDEGCPVEVDVEALKRREPDLTQVEGLFRELEFGRLLDRLRGQGSRPTGPSEAPRAAATPTPLGGAAATGAKVIVGKPARVIDDRSKLEALVAELRAAGELALAVESTGTGPFAPLCGIGFATEAGDPAYLPLAHRYLGRPAQLEPAEAVPHLRPLFADAGVRKHVHGNKEALLALATADLPLEGIVGDPDLAAFLLDPSRIDEKQRQKPLAQIAAAFGCAIEEKDEILGKGKKAVGYETLEIERAAGWAGRRAEATLQLSRLLRPALEHAGLAKLLDEMELPLARVLSVMERHGIRVDTAALGALGAEMARRMAVIEREVNELAGYEVNLGSPKQLQDLLFGKLQLPASKKTKTGYSTDAEVLEELALLHPIPDKILEHRGLAKLKGTYVDALPGLVNPRTGRVHTSFHQTVAGTGRLSSSDPNLQNIPIRSDVGKLIRRAFVADPGNVLIAADYSQIELRVLAHLSGDPVLLDAFRRGDDVHTRTAREMFGVADEAVTAEMRRVAKAINYGLAYGQTDFGLARAVGIGREQAAEYIRSYFARYTVLRAYMEKLVRTAHEEGGARTLFGRFRPLPELESKNRQIRQMGERMARNTPIQGTAADLLKMAMIRAQARLEREFPRARMLLTVHDELVLEAPAGEAEAVGAMVKEAMETVAPLQVPLSVDLGTGANWAEC